MYQVSAESIKLIAEISEQIGILETLTGHKPEAREEAFNPFVEDDLFRAHENMVDALSEGIGRYYQNDQRINLHMKMLFDWLNNTDEHPLISSCIFHYEMTAIHPFSEGNERLGLCWQ